MTHALIPPQAVPKPPTIDRHPCLQFAQVRPVVDFFHFDKNHKGDYCRTMTNPHRWKELNTEEANLSVCEQRFKYVAPHKKSCRYMNSVRFNFTLAMLAWLDHKARAEGLL